MIDIWWQIAPGLDQEEFPVAGGTGNFERIWYMHGGQPYFLASVTILPCRFFTCSSLSFEYGRLLMFAKNMAVLLSTSMCAQGYFPVKFQYCGCQVCICAPRIKQGWKEAKISLKKTIPSPYYLINLQAFFLFAQVISWILSHLLAIVLFARKVPACVTITSCWAEYGVISFASSAF